MAKKIPEKYQQWIEARKRFHLSDAHIQMARELGLSPKKFGGLVNTSPDFSHSDYEKAFRSGIVAVLATTYARRERPHDADRVYSEPVRLSRPRKQEGSRRI